MPSDNRPGGLAAAMVRATRWWRGLEGIWRYIFAGSAAVMVALVVAIVMIAGRGTSGQVPRARQYLAFTACLLTGPGGLAGKDAAAAWAGMERASLKTHAKAQYLAVTSGTTAGAAAPYLASLVARHCGAVIAAGAGPAAAAEDAASRYRAVRFAVLGGGVPGPNLVVVRGRHLSAAVAGLVSAAVSASR